MRFKEKSIFERKLKEGGQQLNEQAEERNLDYKQRWRRKYFSEMQ